MPAFAVWGLVAGLAASLLMLWFEGLCLLSSTLRVGACTTISGEGDSAIISFMAKKLR